MSKFRTMLWPWLGCRLQKILGIDSCFSVDVQTCSEEVAAFFKWVLLSSVRDHLVAVRENVCEDTNALSDLLWVMVVWPGTSTGVSSLVDTCLRMFLSVNYTLQAQMYTPSLPLHKHTHHQPPRGTHTQFPPCTCPFCPLFARARANVCETAADISHRKWNVVHTAVT